MTATLTLPAAPVQTVRFHLSLNVSDLSRSVVFYRTLFGVEPAKLRSDYAKFELDDPPLVLSLEPTPRGSGGALNHAGFRMPDAASLVRMQERLERAGVRAQREEGVECCYARQTKFWVYDPDRTLWEIYTLDGDIEHRGAGQAAEKVQPDAAPPAEAVVWEHRMGQDVPGRAPFADGSTDEVRLRGSLNLPLTDGKRVHLLAEARRVLRPGGIFLCYVPTIVQSHQIAEALQRERHWALVETFETLYRPWNIEGQSVRPFHRMVAHTGFITVARRVVPEESGAPDTRLRHLEPAE